MLETEKQTGLKVRLKANVNLFDFSRFSVKYISVFDNVVRVTIMIILKRSIFTRIATHIHAVECYITLPTAEIGI